MEEVTGVGASCISLCFLSSWVSHPRGCLAASIRIQVEMFMTTVSGQKGRLPEANRPIELEEISLAACGEGLVAAWRGIPAPQTGDHLFHPAPWLPSSLPTSPGQVWQCTRGEAHPEHRGRMTELAVSSGSVPKLTFSKPRVTMDLAIPLFPPFPPCSPHGFL